ncbi:MAG: hypothetical protein JSW07_20660 [bacterium]|nr:MAG: hypothetical protein JSW07_20660 [bacterium]
MHLMRFDVRDIFKSTRLALSLQRIWIQFLGLLFGYVGYLFFTYISFITAGIGLSTGWKRYGLLPCLLAESSNWYSFIIYLLGVIWLIAVYLIAATAVSRATYMVIKGNHFYTWRDALRFALKKTASVLVSPVAILLIIVFLLAGGAVIGLLGKIPFVGEFGITIFTFLWFFAALFVVFLVIIFVVALIQAPAIIATTNDDAFEAIFQTFSLVWSQPWRLILYEFFSAAMGTIGILVLAFLSKKAFIVMDRVFSNVMGADFINISSHGMYLLNIWLFHSITWVNSILGDMSGLVYFSQEFIPLQLPQGYQYVASYIFAIWMLIIAGLILSYGLASFNVGNTLSYLILRKKKDDENLLERKDPEEEDEDEEKDKEGEVAEESKPEEVVETSAELVTKEKKKKSKDSES